VAVAQENHLVSGGKYGLLIAASNPATTGQTGACGKNKAFDVAIDIHKFFSSR